MKISEMDNNQAADALVRIAEPVGNICDDEDFISIWKEINGMKKSDVNVVRAFGRSLPMFVGYALKKHRDDFFEIIGALDGKSKAAVAKMNFAETVKLVRDSYDDILAGFFTRSAPAEKMIEKS